VTVTTTDKLENLIATYQRHRSNYRAGGISEFQLRMQFVDQADVKRHDRMVSLVQQILDLHEQRAAARTDQDKNHFQRLINATDCQIDRLVYELYYLTEEEITIVERKQYR
jgi:hypothetical protein